MLAISIDASFKHRISFKKNDGGRSLKNYI